MPATKPTQSSIPKDYGSRSLAAQRPDVAAEWDEEKNYPLTPEQVTAGSHRKVHWICSNKHSYVAEVKSRSNGTGCPVEAGKQVLAGFNDLASQCPDIAHEWDEKKNYPLTSAQVTVSSNKKVHWLCPNGHSYQATVNSRTGGNTGCPVEAGRQVLAGVNDLASQRPGIAEEWDEQKNYPLTSAQVTVGSHRKVYWICSEGHSWFAQVSSRTRLNGAKCPVEAGKQVLAGVNDLASQRPDIAEEWDEKGNSPLTSAQVTVGSHRKVYWICPKGHSYQALICDRTGPHGTGCPVEAGRQVLAGVNDLTSQRPDIAADWDDDRNYPLTSAQVTVSSNKKVHWLCPNGHSYQARVQSRTELNTKCPVDSGQKVLAGFNDLASQRPDIADEWDDDRNYPLTSAQVTVGTSKKVHWLCPNGHSYQATVYSRTGMDTGCPVEAGKQVLAGFNDLASQRPDIAADWDDKRNQPLTSAQLAVNSHRKVHWLCPEGHSYQARISHRTGGSGCPVDAAYGYDQSKPGLVYILSLAGHPDFPGGVVKVGITGLETRRLRGFERLGWKVERTFDFADGTVPPRIERSVFDWFKGIDVPHCLNRKEMGEMGGYKETFSLGDLEDAGVGIADIVGRIEYLSESVSAT